MSGPNSTSGRPPYTTRTPLTQPHAEDEVHPAGVNPRPGQRYTPSSGNRPPSTSIHQRQAQVQSTVMPQVNRERMVGELKNSYIEHFNQAESKQTQLDLAHSIKDVRHFLDNPALAKQCSSFVILWVPDDGDPVSVIPPDTTMDDRTKAHELREKLHNQLNKLDQKFTVTKIQTLVTERDHAKNEMELAAFKLDQMNEPVPLMPAKQRIVYLDSLPNERTTPVGTEAAASTGAGTEAQPLPEAFASPRPSSTIPASAVSNPEAPTSAPAVSNPGAPTSAPAINNSDSTTRPVSAVNHSEVFAIPTSGRFVMRFNAPASLPYLPSMPQPGNEETLPNETVHTQPQPSELDHRADRPLSPPPSYESAIRMTPVRERTSTGDLINFGEISEAVEEEEEDDTDSINSGDSIEVLVPFGELSVADNEYLSNSKPMRATYTPSVSSDQTEPLRPEPQMVTTLKLCPAALGADIDNQKADYAKEALVAVHGSIKSSSSKKANHTGKLHSTRKALLARALVNFHRKHAALSNSTTEASGIPDSAIPVIELGVLCTTPNPDTVIGGRGSQGQSQQTIGRLTEANNSIPKDVATLIANATTGYATHTSSLLNDILRDVESMENMRLMSEFQINNLASYQMYPDDSARAELETICSEYRDMLASHYDIHGDLKKSKPQSGERRLQLKIGSTPIGNSQKAFSANNGFRQNIENDENLYEEQLKKLERSPKLNSLYHYHN